MAIATSGQNILIIPNELRKGMENARHTRKNMIAPTTDITKVDNFTGLTCVFI